MSYTTNLTVCEHCGGEYGGYAVGVLQHYCPRLGGRRMFRDQPTETEQQDEDARMRDPAYQRQFFDQQNERHRR